MTRTMSEAFNEWMRRYIEEPEKFRHDWETIIEYSDEIRVGEVPSYGDNSTKYLTKLMEED